MNSPDYPALLDKTTRQLFPLRNAPSFVVGRSETADITVLDASCSRQHFRIVRANDVYQVEALSRTSPTFHNRQEVQQRVPLAHNDELRAGVSEFVFLAQPPGASLQRKMMGGGTMAVPPSAPPPAPPFPAFPRATPAPRLPAAAPAQQMGTMMARPGAPADDAAPPEELEPIVLSGRMLIGREADRVQIPLVHPQVSRLHAHITLQGDRAVLVDLNSANGTFVNGQRIQRPVTLRPGDQIGIGPYALLFDGEMLRPRTRADNVELVAHAVRRVVTNRETGKPLTLLADVSLVIRPHEFVCLLGPSGSGKSTLLSALSGRTNTDGGCVLVNGQDLHANFDALKHDIAVVPQKDILHDSLSVGDALWYTARLRLPPDLGKGEIRDCIHETLETVGLSSRRGTLIRHLSGGQVKRASLANEIMCKPSLLFLDEVTSGLDEQTDRDMMDLFRSVADTGKTVVCITHSLANVERTCHLVVILTAGGCLAFIGKPSEALGYFGITKLGDVYDRLKEHDAVHWQKEFKKHPLYQTYVASRLPQDVEARDEPPKPFSGGMVDRGKLMLRQTTLLTQRYAAIWRGDYLSLLAMLGQSILVAVLLGILFGDLSALKIPQEHATRSLNLLFLLAVTSFWFGCNNAAKEIVKERTIYTKERDFNVQALSYFSSKLFLLVLFSGIQAMALACIVWFWCKPPGDFVSMGLMLALLAFAGVSLGLAISAFAPTEEMAITLIPVAIIPQIILSGMIAPVTGLSKNLARSGITVYWGNRGLDTMLTDDLAKAAYPVLEKGSLNGSLGVVFAHGCAYILATLVILILQGRRAGLLGKLLKRAG